MSNLTTGKRYEASGTVAVINRVWLDLKKADPKAVCISAASDDVSTVGTDERDAAMLMTSTNLDGVVFADTGR